jgi:hypothetical protein
MSDGYVGSLILPVYRASRALHTGSYIDKTGKIIINPQFDSASDFHEGMAWAKFGKQYGYIDKTGKLVINPQFDFVGDFHGPLASVGLQPSGASTRAGYIDKSGKYIWNPSN